jgi:hypothetical protein
MQKMPDRARTAGVGFATRHGELVGVGFARVSGWPTVAAARSRICKRVRQWEPVIERLVSGSFWGDSAKN